jgi:two-component sensor histidine kinase/tetratricopeptide (TPR) repeat protein
VKLRIRYHIICIIVLFNINLVLSQENNLSKLQKRWLETSNAADKFDAGSQIGKCYLFNNPDSSYYFFKESIRIADSENNINFKAQGYHNLAIYYKTVGDYNLSIENTIIALTYYDETKDMEGVIDGNALLGHNYALREDYTQSFKHYEVSINLADEYGKESKKTSALIGKGNVLYFMNKLDEASAAFEQAIRNSEKYNSGDDVTKAGLYNNTGNLYLTKDDYRKAIENYTKAFKIYFELKDKIGMSLISFNIGDAYLGVNDYDSSLKYFNINLFLAQELNINEEIKYAYKGLTNLYEQKLQYDSAYKYYNLFIQFKDSVRDVQYSVEVDALVNKYKEERNEKELLAANEKVAQGKIIQEQSERIINLLIVGGIFLLALFLLVYWMYRRSQKANQLVRDQSKVISNKNESIDKALLQKDILLKEVHHRVKNNLQIIRSLLNLQTKKLKSKAAIQAIEDSKNRVQAIALMHKSLYQDEHFNRVDLKGYFEDLIDNHKALFVSDKNKLHFEIEIEELMVSVDDAVPLGLIISELISNSIKHAFGKEVLSPQITLILIITEDQISLTFADNGIGVDADFDLYSLDSLGFEIITALTDQIQGEIKVKSKKPFSIEILLAKRSD